MDITYCLFLITYCLFCGLLVFFNIHLRDKNIIFVSRFLVKVPRQQH